MSRQTQKGPGPTRRAAVRTDTIIEPCTCSLINTFELNWTNCSFPFQFICFHFSPNLSTGGWLFILLKSFALAIWQDYMVLASVILVKSSFIIPFNSVNFRLKGAGKNSHRFVIAGSWPSTPAPASTLVLNPKRFGIPPKLVQRQKCRVPLSSTTSSLVILS